MDKVLYIIGNGFDLHHHLKTSYYNFASFLKENYKSLYDSLDKHISYPASDKDLWLRFEENLANLDVEDILWENVNYLPDISSDDFRSGDLHVFPDVMHQEFEKLTTGLKDSLLNFIQQVDFPHSAFQYKVKLEKSAIFLNFNYTNTLERLYNIPTKHILYIHNSAFYGPEEIIIGHGIDPKNFEEKSPELPDNLSKEETERWYEEQGDNYDYSYNTGKDNIMGYYNATYKPTQEIINKHDDFFNNLDSIEKIFVFGHSISSVDLPYFEKIVSSATKWTISYYHPSDIPRYLKALKSIGLDEKNIYFTQLTDIQESNNQLKIPFN